MRSGGSPDEPADWWRHHLAVGNYGSSSHQRAPNATVDELPDEGTLSVAVGELVGAQRPLMTQVDQCQIGVLAYLDATLAGEANAVGHIARREAGDGR